MNQASYVGGVSAICALGKSMDIIEEKIMKGQSAFRRNHRYQEWLDVPCGEINCQSLLAFSKDTDEMIFQMSCDALEQIHEQSSLFSRYRPDEIGLFIGTTTMGSQTTLEQFRKLKHQMLDINTLHWNMQQNTLTEKLQRKYPLKGYASTFSSACSSGAMAIWQAHIALSRGMFKACIAGGFDAITLLTLMGFSSLQVLDPEPCQPFSKNGKGITLADGGALLLLEQEPSKHCFGRILGGGACSEGYHMTHPEPNGSGMSLSMTQAINTCQLKTSDIAYINAHGSGTYANDTAEKKAIASVFGEHVLVHATKAWHGHTLGGAGALEAAISLRALSNLPTWRQSCHGNLNEVPSQPIGLSNSFGFGGNNVTLALQAVAS